MKAIWEAFGISGTDEDEIMEAMENDPFNDDEVYTDEDGGVESERAHEMDYDYEVVELEGEDGEGAGGVRLRGEGDADLDL